MSELQKTLVVKHLPREFGADDVEDFLKHFGASRVRYMGNKGKLKNYAFATFDDNIEALSALKRLHQLKVSNSVLSVEFSKSQQKPFHPTLLEDPQLKDIKQKELEDDKSLKERAAQRFKEKQLQYLEDVNNVCDKWKVHYPLNPKLEYMYPSPTVAILTNIANALASHPSFYVQVLHLMNKMNLPPPFGPQTPSPPMAEDIPQQNISDEKQKDTRTPEVMQVMTSSEESELESDGEISKTIPDSLKRPKEQSKKVRKKHKFQPILPTPKVVSGNPSIKVSEIFEQSQSQQAQKKIELKLSVPDAPVPVDTRVQKEAQPSALLWQASESAVPITAPQDILDVVAKQQQDTDLGGFGKLEPKLKESNEEETEAVDDDWKETEFITYRELKKGRLSNEQLKDFSVFKSYSPGEPTTRLYIKNLAKQTTEEDLHRIFGRYIDWSSEEERIMFDIRLMKEGRMKGQAFITLANEEASVIAMKETNAFVLNNKPMVVQFARSARPKEKETSKK